MIRSETFYYMWCDKCFEFLKNEKRSHNNKEALFDKSEQAKEEAKKRGWLITDDGFHFCPECKKQRQSALKEVCHRKNYL